MPGLGPNRNTVTQAQHPIWAKYKESCTVLLFQRKGFRCPSDSRLISLLQSGNLLGSKGRFNVWISPSILSWVLLPEFDPTKSPRHLSCSGPVWDSMDKWKGKGRVSSPIHRNKFYIYKGLSIFA